MLIENRNNKPFVLVLLLAILLTASSVLAQSEEIVAIHNGLVFTATGEDPIHNGVIVIENGLIMAVGSAAEVDIPEGTTRIDAAGGTIMPGIINARASTLLNRLSVTDGELDFVGLQFYLINTLKGGVTTLRATGWDFKTRPDQTELRDALAAQGNNVPTIMIAGLLTRAEGNVFEIYPEDTVGVVTLEETQQAVEDLMQSGADQIGFLQAIPPDSRAENNLLIGLSAEQQAAVVEIAHEQDLRVIAQTSFPEDAAVAVAAGVDEIINWPHGYSDEPLSDDLIQALVANEVPVLTGFSVGVIRPYEGDVRRFIDAGGTVVFGTFGPNSAPLDAPYNEMSLMARVGEMTPTEILMAATANAAEAVGLGDAIGTLEVGKRADIIIVNGNPLEDLRAIREVTTVIKTGEVVFSR